MINNVWFELAIVNLIFSIGNIFMGHFEEHTPKMKRVTKILIFNFLIFCISTFFGQMWSFITLGILVSLVLFIHLIVLPQKGINGWTAEPKEKYYKFRGWEDKL